MNDVARVDAELIAAALDGQSLAFGELVCRYQDRLYHALVHLVGSADDARDIAQDAFVQAYVKLESFQGASAFYTWLYRIAMNLAASRFRRQRRQVSVDAGREQAGQEPTAVDRGPGERLMQAERVEQVQAALLALSDEHRHVLVLRELEGWSYETIADTLDLPVGTVRSRLHRARIELRSQLQEVFEEDLK
ncbi:MAG: sigma-70 family RNA polymerase sigma factor [Pirellulales bacterium]|nr:sigma-70 family RNA polymerase sigma factor [Pirellulales bacterium]